MLPLRTKGSWEEPISEDGSSFDAESKEGVCSLETVSSLERWLSLEEGGFSISSVDKAEETFSSPSESLEREEEVSLAQEARRNKHNQGIIFFIF